MPKHVDWLPMRTPTDGEYIVLRRKNGSVGKNYQYAGPVYRFDGGWYIPRPSSEFSGWVSRKTWEEGDDA